MNKIRRPNRREFLKAGVAGIAGAALLPACSGQRLSPADPVTAPKVVVRTLGKTGLKLPVLSMGSIYAADLVRAALDHGIVYIHTSSGYGERSHERLLGEIFKNRPRDSFVVATSPDFPYRPMRGISRSADIGTGVDPAVIFESIEGSLERLGLDYVDVYYLCSADRRETVLCEPYIRAYEQLKREGRVRFAGVATHANEPEVIRAAAESGFWEIVLTAHNFRQSYRDEVRAAIDMAAGAGLGVVAMKTQAGVYWDRLRTRKINMKAALKWVLQNENVHTAIPAFSTFDEMFEDLSIMEDLTLTPEEREDLALGPALGLSGIYCQQCRRCVEQCPAGMDLPALMRGYMYAVGHEEPARAAELLRDWRPADVACAECAECKVACALGHDVRSRSMEMARFLASGNGDVYRSRVSGTVADT